MTPEERAAKLWGSPETSKIPWTQLDCKFVVALAEQIEQAEQEAYRKGFEDCRGKAVNIAVLFEWKNYGDDDCTKIAPAIHALKPEDK